MSHSHGLSRRLTQLVDSGKRLNADSCLSEGILSGAMCEIIQYAVECFAPLGYNIVHEKKVSLFECQTFFAAAGGPPPDPNNQSYMKPDGGILYAENDGVRIPILIVEDKVQGTNDTRCADGLGRQATGNAIERAAKNVRAAEMIFSGVDYFPYVIFASGCDFHSTETISNRLVMMNMGYPNHYIGITNTTTEEQVRTSIANIIPTINVKKNGGRSIASIFVKAHKWDEMKHGSSNWTKDERVHIMRGVIDSVRESFPIYSKPNT
jgi:hypothetical protein